MAIDTAPETTNGVADVDPAETEDLAATVLPEPDEKETVPRFGDPREAVVTIVRDRLERMLQPVDDDPVWHGVNVITAKDLDIATAEDLPPASIFAASVRTPAYIYVDAVCPVCNIAGSITLQVEAKLTAVQGSRKLQLAAKATALPHVCGQKRLELGGPSRPAKGQTALDLGDDVDPDHDDGQMSMDDVEPAPDVLETGAGDLEDQLEEALTVDQADVDATDRDAIHSIAGAKPKDEPDDLSDLPF